MLEQLKLLVKLQKLDKTLYDLTQELEAIPQRLEELSQAEEVLTSNLEQNQAVLSEIENKRKLMETENDQIQARVRKAETRLMSSKNQREYRAATAEIQEGKETVKGNEEALLSLMEDQEALKAQIADIEGRLKTVTADAEEQKELLSKRSAEVQAQVDKLSKKRGGLTKGIDFDLLDRYDFIRENRQGVALAPVSKGVCGVCHMRIPPQQFNELQRMDRIMDCPSCRRLIYWADAEKIDGDDEE